MTTAPAPGRPQPTVELRTADPSDAALLVGWREERSVTRYQPLAQVTSAQLRAELAQQRPGDLYRGRGEKFQWIVLSGRQPAGWITLVVTNWEHGLAEVGYALSTPFQRRGLMLRALATLLDDVFRNTRIERIEARCAVDNLPSRKVLARVGFALEGRLRSYFVLDGRRVDNYLFAILREDFLGRWRP